MSAPTPAEKKSKFKFSNLLHSKDKDPVNNIQRNSNSDSGYGGSEPSVAAEPYNQNAAPSLTGSDESRNNRDDQGQTVTTTTTTTTTTTSGGGLNTSVENNAPPNQSSNPDHNSRNEQGSPPIPMRSSLRDRSPNPSTQGSSTMRDRSPIAGTSPSRTNFSYPNRGPFVAPAGQAPPTQQQAQQGTLQGLKSAARGINGASETLRGTLNSAVDRHTNAPPEILAEHDRTIANGRQDMERMHAARAGQGTAAPPKGILKKVQR
ncbi:MAG: hypothetical protein Q9170_004363 [Blastenia crenularia]